MSRVEEGSGWTRRRAGALLLAALLAVTALGLGLPRLRFDVTTESYFVRGDPALERYEAFQRSFDVKAARRVCVASIPDAPGELSARLVDATLVAYKTGRHIRDHAPQPSRPIRRPARRVDRAAAGQRGAVHRLRPRRLRPPNVRPWLDVTVLREAVQERIGHPVAEGHRPHMESALAWLLRSQDASPDGGFARGYSLAYHPFFRSRGWQPPYPETTGYLIPTLYLAGDLLQRPELHTRAEHHGSRLV